MFFHIPPSLPFDILPGSYLSSLYLKNHICLYSAFDIFLYTMGYDIMVFQMRLFSFHYHAHHCLALLSMRTRHAICSFCIRFHCVWYFPGGGFQLLLCRWYQLLLTLYFLPELLVSLQTYRSFFYGSYHFSLWLSCPSFCAITEKVSVSLKMDDSDMRPVLYDFSIFSCSKRLSLCSAKGLNPFTCFHNVHLYGYRFDRPGCQGQFLASKFFLTIILYTVPNLAFR